MYRLLLALKPCFKMLEQFSVNKETELNSTARLGGAEERNRRAGRVRKKPPGWTRGDCGISIQTVSPLDFCKV
jgi:hypothetical protein